MLALFTGASDVSTIPASNVLTTTTAQPHIQLVCMVKEDGGKKHS